MKNTNFGVVLVAVLVVVGLSGCAGAGSADSSTSNSKAEKAAFLDGLNQGMKKGQAGVEKAYADGYAEAKAKYDPVHHEVVNRTARYTLDVDPGQSMAFYANTTHESTLVWKAVHYGGPRFDVFVAANSALSGQGDEVDECSDWDATTTEHACDLAPGTYRIVVDNTVKGGAAPAGSSDDDVVRLRFTFEVYWTEAV